METFTWNPDYAPQGAEKPRVLKSGFGDGYTQRVGDGLNRLLPKWDLTFSKRTQAEYDAILAFLRARDGRETFLWNRLEPAVSDLQFGTGDGVRQQFYLVDQFGKRVSSSSPVLYRTDWQGKQRLYSPARTNLLSYSNGFAGDKWYRSNYTSTANAATAPNGTMTGTVMTTASAAARPYLQKNINLPIGTYRLNLWVSGVGSAIGKPLNLWIWNLSSGKTTPTNPMATFNAPSGWTRYSVPFVVTTAGDLFARLDAPSPAVVGDQVAVWECQVEPGDVDTPNIHTDAAAVTLTDYVLGSSGSVALAVPPVSAAVLSWSGAPLYPFLCPEWKLIPWDGGAIFGITASFEAQP